MRFFFGLGLIQILKKISSPQKKQICGAVLDRY
jgi:hypothetical protein